MTGRRGASLLEITMSFALALVILGMLSSLVVRLVGSNLQGRQRLSRVRSQVVARRLDERAPRKNDADSLLRRLYRSVAH